jgi:hypothetical protein
VRKLVALFLLIICLALAVPVVLLGRPPAVLASHPAPSGLRVTGTTSDAASLDWDDYTAFAIGRYRVSRYTGSGSLIDRRLTGRTSAYTWTGLQPSNTYQFAVQAVASDGHVSTRSPRVTATSKAPPPPTGDELRLSLESDRSPSQALQGGAISGNACVFLPGHEGDGPVKFHLDEPPDATPFRTENGSPWDFGGGSVATCTFYDFNQLSAGEHKITAVWTGGQDSATFTVVAPPSPTTKYGFHQDLAYFGSSSVWRPRLNAAASIGSQVSRNSMLWDVVEPTNDGFSWARYDALVADIEAKGMVPVFTLVRSPSWANGNTDKWVVPADQAQFNTWVNEYAEFAGQVAARYAGQGLLYEIWNEPNERYFWKASSPSIDRYAQLFTAARNAMLAADRTAKVGLGGITGLGASCCIAGRDFISGLIDRGVQFGYVGIHPYDSGLNSSPDHHAPFDGNFDDTLMIHNLLESRGRTGVKLWLTEWGWYGCSPDDAVKSAWIKRAHERIRDEWSSFVTISSYFFDVDTTAYPCGGVFRSNFTRKPLADAFERFMTTVP